VDGKVVATESLEKTIPVIFTIDETFDIGSDTGTGVDDQDYQVPFNFTGSLGKLTIALERPQLTPADIQKLKAGEMNAADAK
jgi:arylsulfatase